MKRLLLVVVMFACGTSLRAGCTKENGTNLVRVHTNGCNTQGKEIYIKVTTKDGRHTDSGTARRVDENTFERALPFRINALNADLLMLTDAGYAYCCERADEAPLTQGSLDCYVQFEAHCDRTDWGFAISTRGETTAFNVERIHRDGFNDVTCNAKAPVPPAKAFGSTDEVHLQITRCNFELFDYTIDLDELKRRGTLPIRDVKRYTKSPAKKDACQKANPTVRALIEQQVPASITITSQP